MLARLGLQPSNRLTFPEAMQAKTEQVVELVVAGRDLLEQLLNRLRISGPKARHPRATRSNRG